jgi:hypothetical protein
MPIYDSSFFGESAKMSTARRLTAVVGDVRECSLIVPKILTLEHMAFIPQILSVEYASNVKDTLTMSPCLRCVAGISFFVDGEMEKTLGHANPLTTDPLGKSL